MRLGTWAEGQGLEVRDKGVGKFVPRSWLWPYVISVLEDVLMFHPRHLGSCTTPLPDSVKASGPLYVSPGKEAGSWDPVKGVSPGPTCCSLVPRRLTLQTWMPKVGRA